MARRYSLSASVIVCSTLALASASLVLTTGASVAAAKRQATEAHVATATTSRSDGKGKGQAKHEPKSQAKGHTKAGEISADPLDRSAFAKASPEEAGACLTARKKLWVEGEGWIVRRVTTCQ